MSTNELPNGCLNGCHVIGKAFLDLGHILEGMPASEAQTEACIARDVCTSVVKMHVDDLEEVKARLTRERDEAVSESLAARASGKAIVAVLKREFSGFDPAMSLEQNFSRAIAEARNGKEKLKPSKGSAYDLYE